MEISTQQGCHTRVSTTPAARIFILRRVWQILCAVLRGYCAGQPITEERPRKGCC